MDPTGPCVIFDQNLLPKCLCRALAENFDFDKFRRICILSGCDYLQVRFYQFLPVKLEGSDSGSICKLSLLEGRKEN